MSYANHPQQPAPGGWGTPPAGGAPGAHPPGRYGQPAAHYGQPPQYGPGPQQHGQPQYGQPGQPGPGQYAPQPQGYPQAATAAGSGQGQVVVDIKHHPLAFAFTLVTPKITINGYPLLGRWGPNALPLPPGRHHLRVHLPYLLPSEVGPAELAVPVNPGQTTQLEYRAPMWAFSPGALGPPPQKWNGMTALLLVMAVPIGLVLLLFLLRLLFALA